VIRGVYLILDPDQTGMRSAIEIAQAALHGGASAIQWRQKTGSIAARWLEILAVRDLCSRHAVPFLVNDRVDVALAVHADGAHVGQDDLPAEVARQLIPGKLLGVSVSRPAEIPAAEAAGADYLGAGPIFPTPSKPDAAPAVGLGILQEMRLATTLPLVAIGGITPENAAQVKAAGADAIAVISAICGAVDVEAATRSLAKAFEGVTVR
jgi:thiamine-phosphate pyrophosphorylase